jgi:hypothetical protein
VTIISQVQVVEGGESRAKPGDCRGLIVGADVNQPDPFPGYAGFVGWESPIRLVNGDWLVGFNAGYCHASAPTPLRYPAKELRATRDDSSTSVAPDWTICSDQPPIR